MIPIDEIDANKVYTHLRDVFKDELSPLDWFIHNDSDRIIVLNYWYCALIIMKLSKSQCYFIEGKRDK